MPAGGCCWRRARRSPAPSSSSKLRAQPLFADEDESIEWRRKLGAAVGVMLRQNAPLKTIAEARPPEGGREGLASADVTVPDQWESLSTLARPGAARGAARPRVHRPHSPGARACQQARPAPGRRVAVPPDPCRRPQHRKVQQPPRAAGHAGVRAGGPGAGLVAAGGAQPGLRRAEHERGHGRAAGPPGRERYPDHRGHARADPGRIRSRARSCCARPAWTTRCGARRCACTTTTATAQTPLAELPQPRQLARLLRRADIFTAKISRRRTRAPMSPVQAAREACLGAGGVPDEVGGALLRATGLYPPGSFVELANGERGIVVARGRRANLPWVASLVAPSGRRWASRRCATPLEARFAVRAAVPQRAGQGAAGPPAHPVAALSAQAPRRHRAAAQSRRFSGRWPAARAQHTARGDLAAHSTWPLARPLARRSLPWPLPALSAWAAGLARCSGPWAGWVRRPGWACWPAAWLGAGA